MRLSHLGLVLGSLAFSSASFASTTAQVELGGTVTSTLLLSSSTTAQADELDLMHGTQIVKVADLMMSTNNEQGLTLTASSGSLQWSGGTSIPYQVTSVVAEQPAPDSSAFQIASGGTYSVGTVVAGGVAKDLYIMYTPAALQDPGYYGDTINLSVSDN